MARPKKGISTADICSLLFFLSQVAFQVSAKVTEYKDFDIRKQWSQAREACKQKNKILAQIDNIDLFNSTKERLYNVQSGHSKTYWTGLRYKNKLLWSNGTQTLCNGSLSAILNCANLSVYERCFFIQEDVDTLRATHCDIAHRYICQSVPLTTLPTASTNPTSSNLQMSHPTKAANNNREGLIDVYLRTIRYLNDTHPSSLKQVINATDRLLSNLKATEENMNIVLAAQALEVFVKSFAKRQLTASNDTLIKSRKELVIIMRRVHSNSEDLVVSGSSSDWLNESDVHIRLPASLFHENGGYMTAILYNNIHKLLPSEAQTFLDGNLKTGDTQIRLNFVISIAVAQLIFILGIDATQNKAVCTTVAAAMHYFFLVSFCWMLVEGLTLYYKVVKVFDTDFKMWPFWAFSWGFPLTVVSISLLTAAATGRGIASYVGDSFCWLSFSHGLVWFFVAPVLIISILNVFVLARVTRELFTMHPTNVSSESNKYKRVLRACVVLFPLLGVTWVFGVLSVTDSTGIVFQYLFTICNSLQGFLIFLLHVVRSSEFRATFKRKFQRWRSKRNINIMPAIISPTNNNNNNNNNNNCDMHRDSLASGKEEGLSQKTTRQQLTHSTFTLS